ncbi:MAG: Sec-independent protein translocase subunit TatA [Actinomycetota bacterium]
MTSTAMFISNIRLPEILIILLIVLLLFGARKLPDLARSLGKSMRIMRDETRQLQDNDTESRGSDDRGANTQARQIDAGQADAERAESAHTRPADEESEQLKRDA